jgi:hypothetical protein
MLNCLRITDLPYVAGLLFPTELVFLGERPATYDWTAEFYQQLGAPDKIRSLSALKDWSPSEAKKLHE